MKTLLFFLALHAHAFELGAHRGMYTPLPIGYEPDPKECVAKKIEDPAVRAPAIRYTLENSLPAYNHAFALGADRASINLQLSKGEDGKDGEVVLFHDYALDCKTDHKGFIRDYTLRELKTFNMGAGYEYNKTNPWLDRRIIRGGYTTITTLDELMAVHSDKAYWIVIRPASAEELAAILRKLKPYQTAVANSMLFVPSREPWVKPTIAEVLPEILVPRIDMARNGQCRASFAPGRDLPDTCRNLEFVIQAKDAISLGSALQELGDKLHAAGSRLVIGSETGGFVETIEQAEALLPYFAVIDGMMTNRIDLIGPWLRERRPYFASSVGLVPEISEGR